jgi:hypothetical protein
MATSLPKAESSLDLRDPRDTITESMIGVGVARLRALMRGDTFVQDHSRRTLQMIVREVYLAMANELASK